MGPLKERSPPGEFTDTLPTARFHYRPMQRARRSIGVIGMDTGDADEHDLRDAIARRCSRFIEQAAIAIERTRLVESASKVETAAEGERLRAALLSSISHDLRTPLASIVGSATGPEDAR